MKLSSVLALTILAVPAMPAPAMAQSAAPAAVAVAHYTFDQGISASGVVAENTGRGTPLRVRAAAGGTVRAVAAPTGRYVAFPAPCPATTPAASCPRAVLEGTDDADLDPGTRQFRYGASVLIARSEIKNSANVMQKGVVSVESQWKLQIGATNGKAQCVVVGRGSAQAYIVRSSVSVVDGRWHKVMCMRTPTGLYVFVDGVRHGQVPVPATVSIDNNLPLRIGAPNLNPASDSFNGLLDDAYVVHG